MTLPESPRYLCVKGQTSKAVKVLEYVSKLNNKPLPPGKLEGSMANGEEDTTRESVALTSILYEMFSGDFLWDSVNLFFIWFAVAFIYYGLIIFTTVASTTVLQCGPNDTLPLPYDQVFIS